MLSLILAGAIIFTIVLFVYCLVSHRIDGSMVAIQKNRKFWQVANFVTSANVYLLFCSILSIPDASIIVLYELPGKELEP